MASVSNDEIKEEFAFMGEYFNFRKAFYRPESDDRYWEKLVKSADALGQKYKGSKNKTYFWILLIACVSEIEARARQDGTVKGIKSGDAFFLDTINHIAKDNGFKELTWVD